MEGQPDGQIDQERQALDSFLSYLGQGDENSDVLDPDLWQITPYKDCFIVNSTARSNQAFLVQGNKVIEYAPAWKSIEQAYLEVLSTQPDN